MRPHLLELTAFGAFPDDVVLDFDEVGAGGLVLLCGETGGGKTTLLDALGFALFGAVPGIRGQGPTPDLRSHHAAPDAKPWVRLTFSINGVRHRVARTPAWNRPKKRPADGHTRVNPTALLERADGGTWHPVASRHDDVRLEIEVLLGMNANQFYQVVMLPQGRFADFLHADNNSREALLKRLFGVGRFEFAEQWLADTAKAAAETLDEARSGLVRIASQVTQAGEAEAPDDLESAPGWATDVAERARSQAAEAAARTEATSAARAAADDALARTQRFAERQQERRALTRRLAELTDQRAELDVAEHQLNAARRANVVRAAIDAVAARRQAQRRDDAALAAAVQLLVELGAEPGAAEQPALAASARNCQAEAGRLAGLAATVSNAESADAAALAADRDAARYRAQVESLERRLATEFPTRRVELAEAVESARAASARLGPARERRQLATDLAKSARALATAEQAATAAEVAATTARADAVDLRRQRFEAITAELAAGLEDDTPCPVCGSLNHPDLTEARADHVSKDDELAAEAEADRLAAGHATARTHLGRLAGQFGELRARYLATGDDSTDDNSTDHGSTSGGSTSGGSTGAVTALDVAGTSDPEAFRAAAKVLAATVKHLEPLAAGLAQAETALAELAESETAARAELAEQRAKHEAAETTGRDARTRAADARRHLPPDVADLATLEALRRDLDVLAQAYDVAQNAAGTAQRAADEVRAAVEAATSQATQGGFRDPDEARQALRDDAWTTATTARLQAHRDESVTVSSRLASAELAVDVEADPQLAALTEAALAARRDSDEAVEALGAARLRAGQLDALATRFTEAVATVEPLRADADERRGLADLVAGRGANLENMPLSSFVLAARLEQVAQAASERLSTMSTGRFTMLLDDTGPRDRRKRAGLGLLVEDAWTGRRRATATLSGGETFQAALSLALGLADVVTAESGGRSMDALFIDEGFGTLDPDSLEEVMDALDELRSGGRLVGVVSHVAELRQRISSQIQVVKDSRGSTIRTTS